MPGDGTESTEFLPAESSSAVDTENIWAVSGGQVCYNCGGRGHYARDCPSKGKGKGHAKMGSKGGGKSWDKGGKDQGKKGKGPLGGCWTCGGSHFANESPKGQGKGKTMSLGEWFLAEWAGDARELAMSLKTGDPLPPAAEWKGLSRDRDETVQTIAASPDINATDARKGKYVSPARCFAGDFSFIHVH